MISALFAFLHFLAVFGIFAAVFLQWRTMSPAPTLAEARRIQASDRMYGMLAIVVLVVASCASTTSRRARRSTPPIPSSRPSSCCSSAVGLLSIYPTIRFIKWRAQTKQGLAPVLAASEYGRS